MTPLKDICDATRTKLDDLFLRGKINNHQQYTYLSEFCRDYDQPRGND
jgi:hypothetical protein